MYCKTCGCKLTGKESNCPNCGAAGQPMEYTNGFWDLYQDNGKGNGTSGVNPAPNPGNSQELMRLQQAVSHLEQQVRRLYQLRWTMLRLGAVVAAVLLLFILLLFFRGCSLDQKLDQLTETVSAQQTAGQMEPSGGAPQATSAEQRTKSEPAAPTTDQNQRTNSGSEQAQITGTDTDNTSDQEAFQDAQEPQKQPEDSQEPTADGMTGQEEGQAPRQDDAIDAAGEEALPEENLPGAAGETGEENLPEAGLAEEETESPDERGDEADMVAESPEQT